MLKLLTTETLSGLAVGFVLGFILGFTIALFRKGHVQASSFFAIFVASLWLAFQSISILVSGQGLPFIFDVVGGVAVGQLLGVDIIDRIIKLKSGGKDK